LIPEDWQHAVSSFSTRTGFFSARARHFSVLSAAAQNFIVSSVENAAAFCLRALVTASDGGFLCVSQ
jgi:hypothetical protein